MSRDDHTAFRPLLGGQLLQQLQAHAVGQAHVGDDGIKPLLFEVGAGITQVSGRLDAVTFAQQGELIQRPQVGLVVDDQNQGLLR